MRLMQCIYHFHRDEAGSFSLSHVAASVFLTVVTVSVVNVGVSVSDRAQLQHRADAAAESLGNWKARNLNAVVAHQHLMGELMSLVIVHHALGGELLDQQRAADTQASDRKLNTAYLLAASCKTGTPAYEDVSSQVLADAALLDAHRQLKRWLTLVYVTKAAALAMQAYPPTRPAGDALEMAAHVVELIIHNEWRVLEATRQAALKLTPLKLKVVNDILPSAKKQLVKLIEDYPKSQRALAAELSTRLEVQLHVLPSDRRLPLIEDPLARLASPPGDWVRPTGCNCPTDPADNMRHQLVKVSQLARATFPWVNYHRKPVIDLLKPLTPLSDIATHYFDHTAGMSKRMLDELQRDGQLALFVLDDYRGPDKGYEAWMEVSGSAAADKTFGLTVLAGVRSRELAGNSVFPKMPGEMTYRYASAMVWNEHAPQQPGQRIDLYCKRIVPSFQAQTGWDTLNWAPNVELPELVGFGIAPVFPAIKPAWTSRLSPTSPARLKELRSQPLPDWGTGIQVVLPDGVDSQLIRL